MEHYYQNIGEDWFSYPNLYRSILHKFDNAKFVEIGSWKGRSAIFLAVEIINSGKNIDFYCVDTWKGSPEHEEMDILKEDNLYKEFIKNIEPVSHIIKPVRYASQDACKLFEDSSLDFVFIDAAHDYESVKEDIKLWYPKVKEGGVLAGHDYSPAWVGVMKAVDEWVLEQNKAVSFQEMCWMHYK